MIEVDKEKLYDLYIIQQLPMHKVAKEMGIAVGSVYNYLKKYDIPRRNYKESMDLLKANGWTFPKEAAVQRGLKLRGCHRSEETKKKISESHFKGGIGFKKKRPDGYIAIYFPEHPKSNKEGYIMEHDLVMECLIGRHLKDDEVVHHKNEIKDDNRKCNLQLMTNSEHMSYHSSKRHQERRDALSTQ